MALYAKYTQTYPRSSSPALRRSIIRHFQDSDEQSYQEALLTLLESSSSDTSVAFSSAPGEVILGCGWWESLQLTIVGKSPRFQLGSAVTNGHPGGRGSWAFEPGRGSSGDHPLMAAPVNYAPLGCLPSASHTGTRASTSLSSPSL